MAEKFFPRGYSAATNGRPTPRDVAKQVEDDERRKAHQSLKVAAHRLLRALDTLKDYDATGQAGPALKHIATRGDQLVSQLRNFQEVSDSFSKQEGSK